MGSMTGQAGFNKWGVRQQQQQELCCVVPRHRVAHSDT
jgi:hypothetical protein